MGKDEEARELLVASRADSVILCGGDKQKPPWKPSYIALHKISSLCFVILAQGLTLSLVPATIPELTRVLDLKIESLTTALSMTSVGKVIGCFMGGVMMDKFLPYCDVYLIGIMVLGSMTIVAVLYVPSIYAMGVCFAIQGLVEMSGIVLPSALMIAIPEGRPDSWSVGVIASFTLGTAMAPLIAAAFISANSPNQASATLNMSIPSQQGYHNVSSNTDERYDDTSPQTVDTLIQYPFIIVGSYFLLVAGQLLVYRLKGWTFDSIINDTKKKGSTQQTGTQDVGFCRWITIVILGMLGIQAIDAVTLAFIVFVGPVAIDSSVSMSQQGASVFVAVVNVCLGLSRITTIFAVKHFKTRTVLFLSLSLLCILTFITPYVAFQSTALYWVMSLVVIIHIGPGLGVYVSYINSHIPAYGLVNALLFIGASAGYFIGTWGGGQIYSAYGPDGLWWFIFILTGCSLVFNFLLEAASKVFPK